MELRGDGILKKRKIMIFTKNLISFSFTCICLSVLLYVCMHVYMCCICMYACICVVYVCMHVYIVYMYVCMYICVVYVCCMYILCTCIVYILCICMYACIYVLYMYVVCIRLARSESVPSEIRCSKISKGHNGREFRCQYIRSDRFTS